MPRQGKLRPEAFSFYISVGPRRSYTAVGEKFGVSKRSVTSLAKREDWQRRVEEIDRKARESTDKRAVETIEEMNTRHLKSMKIVQGKALEALKARSIESAMDAVRALDLAVKQERVARGEPTERTAVSVEEAIKREYERWMGPPAEDDSEEEGHDVEGR